MAVCEIVIPPQSYHLYILYILIQPIEVWVGNIRDGEIVVAVPKCRPFLIYGAPVVADLCVGQLTIMIITLITINQRFRQLIEVWVMGCVLCGVRFDRIICKEWVGWRYGLRICGMVISLNPLIFTSYKS